MAVTSPKPIIDNRLVAIEELIRRRKYDQVRNALLSLSESDFTGDSCQHGLFAALQAESAFFAGDYRSALEFGLRGARILADFALNRRYARVLLVLSKSYSATGDLRRAEMKASDALGAYRRAADSLGQVDGLNELARISFIRSDYSSAAQFLDEAIALAASDPRKVAQMTGNVARVYILTGDFSRAEDSLNSALAYNEEHSEEVPQAINLLSLGYLHLRRREHVFAQRRFAEALVFIDKLDLKRQRVIYLEYAGELALERGDTCKAQALLAEAYHQGRLLAPDSSLVSQAGRRLAEAEMALDNFHEAMKYSQKALALSLQIGEKAEIGLSHRVIAQVFAARNEMGEAISHAQQAVDVARTVGDPVDTAKALCSLADILATADSDRTEKIRTLYDEAGRIYKKLKLEFSLADIEFKSGVFACRQGNLPRGFRKLNRSERLFSSLGDKTRVRRVHQFLTSLADQAVALSVSDENELKLFGNLISTDELKGLKSGRTDEVIGVLLARTGADRAIIMAPDFDNKPIMASKELSPTQTARFTESFNRLVGEEFSTTQPTLLLDCRRDPYINELFPDIPDVIASVIVVPYNLSDQTTSFIYLDKCSVDGALNPFSQDELNFAVGFSDVVAFKSAELQKMRLMEDNLRLKAQLQEEAAFPNIITTNHEMHQMLAQVRQVVDSNISIVIEGETGCGKDLVARAIHYNSIRRDKRFISVNCAALPETLLESELFGYRKGSFTGADRDKPGLFEEADGGTFFLDEIADMPLSIQAKILRVLEEKELVRLGESVPRKVDVRILSATNKDLKEEMANGQFRQDLYYRLSALTFRLPPLRERREDIPLLVEHFLTGIDKRLSPETLKHLVGYDWPGNIRELENEIKKLTLLAGDSEVITPGLLSSKIAAEAQVMTDALARTLSAADGVEFSEDYSLYDYLSAHERRFIIKALRARKGVKKHAAALLNIPESTLRLKIKEYDIDLSQLELLN